MSDTTFDYIVVGGGTAGALLCNRLSADRNVRVLLLEAGRKDDYHWIHVPSGHRHCIGNPRTDWMYHTTPQAGLHGRSLHIARSKTLGGSSSINGMVYVRGHAQDYDQWAALTGDQRWSWEQVLPQFKKHESHWRLDEGQPDDPALAQWHNHKGEWRVEPQRMHWDILDAFAQAAQSSGMAATEDFNTGNNEGVGYFEVNQKDGLRWNTAKAFLRPKCYGRPNFEMWTMAQVTRLVMERQPNGKHRCTGVRVWTGDEMAVLSATQEVIVCAGAINTPQLLQLSGIGPSQLLHDVGIPLVHHLPGVGANLQDHLHLRNVFKIKDAPTLNTLGHGSWAKMRMGLQYLLRRTGPMSMGPSQLGAFTRSDANQSHPNVELQVQPQSRDGWSDPLHPFPAFTVTASNLRPSSRGTVHITSPNFEVAPAISPNYLSTEQDRQVALDSVRLVHRIVGQAPLRDYQPQSLTDAAVLDSDTALSDWVADHAATHFHPAGTTRMGADHDPHAVLDTQLRVRGVDGLRVVDAGAMPTITSGNTCSPTLMMAEKAAEWIRAERKARQVAPPVPVPSDAPAAAPLASPEAAPASLTL